MISVVRARPAIRLIFTLVFGPVSACTLVVDPGHYGEGANEASPALLLGGERASSQPTATADTLLAKATGEGLPLGWSPQLALPQAGIWHGHASAKQVVAFWYDRMGSVLANASWNGKTLGPWTKQPGPLVPVEQLEAGLALTEGAIFLVGSTQGPGDDDKSKVSIARRNNGAYGEFEAAPVRLINGRFRPTLLVCQGHLLVLGGEGNHLGDPVPVEHFDFAKLTNQNTGVAQFAAGPSFAMDGRPHRVSNAAAVCAFGSVYVLGGLSPTVNETTDVVLSAAFTAEGRAGPWRPQTRLPSPLRQAAAFVSGRRLVVAGGRSGPNAPANTKVISSQIGADGSLSPWVTETAAALPDGWVNARAVPLSN
ncbi:MAG: hypothetical protein SF187_20790 [Deltaproteobacteria bacterium]|nr:hypothetical protein [Deltaproteobacteria bacterium]